MRQLPRVAAITLAGALLLTGCGSDSDSPATTDEGSASEAAAEPLTEAELKSRLLTAADLPAGFTVEPDDPSEDDSGTLTAENAECQELFDEGEKDPDVAAEAEVSFVGGDAGPFLVESLQSYEEGKAEEDFAKAQAALEDCGDLKFADASVTGSLTLTETEVEQRGDETLGYELSGNLQTQGLKLTVTGSLIAIRTGDASVFVFAFALGDTPFELEPIAEKALEKFERAGGAAA